MCSEKKSGIHGRTEGQLGDEKHTYMLYVSVIFLYPWKHSKWRISQITNAHSPFIKAHAWQLMTTSNDVVARWDTSQLPLCSTAEQSRRHTCHTRRQAPNHATNGVDVVLTPGAPRWVGVTISHTSAATAAAVGVGVEGELWLAICLRPRIPVRVQESWTRCRIHTKNPSMKPWTCRELGLNWKRCLIRVLHFAKKLHILNKYEQIKQTKSSIFTWPYPNSKSIKTSYN